MNIRFIPSLRWFGSRGPMPGLGTVLLLCLAGLPLKAGSSSRHVITEFGAKGDGRTLNTAAINRAIQACHDTGGGVVVVPPGTFIAGTLRLLSHVELHLEAGATLKGSTNLGDYQLDGVRRGLIFAREATDLALTGMGTIDGNSDAFFDPTRMHVLRNPGFDRRFTRQGEAYLPPDTLFPAGPIYYEQRPGTLVQMFRCERVVVDSLRFLNPPEWTFRFGDCDDVLVHGVTIRANLKVPNSDGIHLTTSRNVRISDCNLSCGDDTIAITGFGDETGPSPEDPHGMEQRFISSAIFSKMLTSAKSLEGVDRDQLRTAIARGLKNQDGHARSEISAIYRRLSYDELEPLLPAVLEAIEKPAPSGEMFADGVRLNGLKVLAAHHVEEGMQACADYLRTQNPWASENRTPEILEVLRPYGAQAQRILPHLRETAAMFDQGEKNFPQPLSARKAKAVREAIERIEAAQERPDLKRLK